MILIIDLYSKEGKFMKSTGIVREVDELGRAEIPKKLRRTMNIHLGASMEIFLEQDISSLGNIIPDAVCVTTWIMLSRLTTVFFVKRVFLR